MTDETTTYLMKVEIEREHQQDGKRIARRRGYSKIGPYYAELVQEYAAGEAEPRPTPKRNIARLGAVVEVPYDVYRRATARAAAEGKAISRVLEELIERDMQELAQ